MTMRRRRFLATLSTAAGAALLAPYFRSVRAATSGSLPCRFVFVIEGNGTEPVNLMTPGARAAIDADAVSDTGTRRYFPRLYGHDAPLVINDDLAQAPAMAALGSDLAPLAHAVFGLSSKITGGGHTTNFGALSSTRSTGSRPGGPTIESILAGVAGVQGSAPFDAIRLGVHAHEEALNTSTCAYGEARPAPVLIDPAQAFTNLFGAVGDPASQAAFNRRGTLLDYAHADATASLAQFSGNSTERAKLEGYLASLEAVTQRQQQLVAIAPTLSSVVPPDPTASNLYASGDPFERMQAHMDLATAALQGGLTNVAVLACGTGGGFDLPYPSLGAELQRHNLHHFNGVDQATGVTLIKEATRLLMAQTIGLARKLHNTPEGGGTMLDNTLVVFMSGNGGTHHSNAEEWPLLLIGGQNMGFVNDGRTTVFPGVRNANNRQLSNFFNTLGHAAGLDLNEFGKEGPTRIAAGPLSELWS